MTTIRFHDALRRAALALRDPRLPAGWDEFWYWAAILSLRGEQ